MIKLRIIFFSTYTGYSDSGVRKKMINQINELNKLGVDAKIAWFDRFGPKDPQFKYMINFVTKTIEKNSKFNKIESLRFHYEGFKVLKKISKLLNDQTILYIRYPPLIFFYFSYFLLKNKEYKIISEHNTIEIKEFKLTSNYLYYFLELLLGKISRKSIDGFVGVTDEITMHQINYVTDPSKLQITIGNGINVSSIPFRDKPPFFNKNLNILFLASNINKWHGIDRLIYGIKKFEGETRINFHIIGEGPELNHLKKLTENLNLEKEIFFHGFLSGKSLDDIFNQCHIAVGTLGIHRLNMSQASVLKAREYCSRGIPFIYGCLDPDFSKEFPFILFVPADESSINIEEVIEFAKRVYSDPEHNIKMRTHAEKKLDWSVKMKKLKEFCEAFVEG